MVRQVIIGSAVACVLGAVLVTAQGCGDPPLDYPKECLYFGGTNCPENLPCECCQCPYPEACPPFVEPDTVKKIPDWCGPALRDAGCPGKAPYIYTYDLDLCNLGLDGGVDADDPGDGGMKGFCSSGTCVPSAPEAWKHVAFFMDWMRESPACPEDAPNLLFEGSPAPPERTCPACSCDPPEGSCSLPSTWTVSSEVCPGASGVKTNFDPPSAWDGTCSQDNAIAKDKLCGGVPCVRSLTISPPIIDEKPCTPHTEGEVDLPAPRLWSGADSQPIGRACASKQPPPSCLGGGCSGTNSAFGACIMHDGDQVCPDGWTGDRHVLYGNIEDTRECSPCGCDAPKGGTCQVKWRTFAESPCSAENASGETFAGMAPACHDFMPGVALAGKTAERMDYTKGSCMPNGGELVGEIKLDKQVTICCHASTM